VALALGTDRDFVIEEETQELLLFQSRGKRRIPDTRPIAIITAAIEFITLYYLVSEKNLSVGERQTVIVDYSQSGYRRSSRHCFDVGLPRDWEKIETAMLAIIGDSHPIRKILVRSSTIVQVIHGACGHDYSSESIRYEVIPEDQIGVPHSELVRVTRARVDKFGCFIPKGFPFFLNIARQATLDDVKEQLKVACNETDELMMHYRFAVCQGPLISTVVFDKTKILKKDDQVREKIQNPEQNILVWILPADAGLVGSLRGEAVKIKN
jgi:hypothetical protein